MPDKKVTALLELVAVQADLIEQLLTAYGRNFVTLSLDRYQAARAALIDLGFKPNPDNGHFGEPEA